MEILNAIIDADAFVFRAVAGYDGDDVFVGPSRVDNMINIALNEVNAKEQILFLTGKDNFRYQVFPEYKLFRKDKERPKWEQATKQHLVDQWEAIVVDGMEADDACGIAQYGSHKDSTIIIHQDKDINQIAGWHYNFVKKEKYYVTEEEGIRFFYHQLLTGDPTDGIKGVSGIGQKKAEKLLFNQDLEDLYEIVLDQYGSEEEMEMNAQCVYIHRKKGDNWRNLIEAIKR